MRLNWTGQVDWDDARVERLKTLWAQGLSASKIAREMGITSRSAIIGKVHRLNLAPRGRKIEMRKPAYVPRERKMAAFRRPRLAEAAVTAHTGSKTRDERMAEAERMRARFSCEEPLASGGLTIMQLKDDTCRWPHGDPSDESFRYCGADTGGETYCPAHHRMSVWAYAREAAE